MPSHPTERIAQVEFDGIHRWLVFKMSKSLTAATDHDRELSESDRHLLLAVERRRVALDVLTEGSAPIFLDDLAVAVVEREVNDCVATEESVERVAISLHHHHLPKMENIGVVQYDPDERLVIRTPASDSNDLETATGTRSTSPQGDRYLTEISDAEIHRLLANERRRTALEALSELTPPVALEDLAALVAMQESSGLVTNDEQEASVAIALHHAHLPMLDELGIIEYNPEKARVDMCSI